MISPESFPRLNWQFEINPGDGVSRNFVEL